MKNMMTTLMKSFTGILFLFVGVTHAYATNFICDYKFLDESQNEIDATFTIEKINGEDAIVLRQVNPNRMLYAFAVIDKKMNALGTTYLGEVAVEENKMNVDLVVPKVLPNPGRIVWDEAGSEQIYCRGDGSLGGSYNTL